MSRTLTLALTLTTIATCTTLGACSTPRPVTGPTKATTTPRTSPPPKVTGAVEKPNPGSGAAAKKVAGVACQTGEECQSGTCEGKGCGATAPGICAPSKRMCTRDLRTYCGCDGKTFQGSGSCPGHRYKAVGPCQAPAPIKVTP